MLSLIGEKMNLIELVYILAFGVATVACFAGVVRAIEIEDKDVRYGLVGLLVGSGGWAASHTAMFVTPQGPFSRASYIVGLILGFSTVWAWLYFCSAYAGRLYHRSKLFRRASVVTYLAVVGVKLTNPYHHLYFTAEFVDEPFVYLRIQQGLLHWIVTGFSYVMAGIGLFVLFETFVRAEYDTRPLGVLVGLTAIPVTLDIAGYAVPQLVDIIYAPLGVSAFALGVLYVFEERFLAVKMSAGQTDPTVVVDDDGRIRDYNDAAVSLFPELPESRGDDFDSVGPAVDRSSLRRDGGDGGRIVSIERGNGTEYYVESSNAISIGNDDIGTIVTYTDITDAERKRRELERTYGKLEREQDRFANLFEYLPDPVNEVEFVDGKPIVEAINTAFEDTFGYTESQVVGRDANDVISAPEDVGVDPETVDRKAQRGDVITEEVRRRTADGVRDFLFRGIPYRTDGNTRALGVFTDITEQKRRQRRLGVLNRVLRHNVRNEMTVVRGHAELLVDELDDGRLSNSAEELLTSAREVTRISEQIRETEKAIQRSRDEAVDLHEVVESTLSDYRDRYPDAVFEVDVDEDSLVVEAGGMDLALMNLLENAVEHTESDEPTVRVTLRRESPGWAVLRVEDDGPGIPEVEQSVVVGDSDVTQLEHGSGLGLWVVKWVSEANGGELGFGQADLGGACVEIRLPLRPESGGQ